MFRGIRKLPAGSWLRIREDGSIAESRYWDVLDHTQPLVNAPEEEIAERIVKELRTAVRLRKVSDVRVGVFLSGGIDLSVNALQLTRDRKTKRTKSARDKGHHREIQRTVQSMMSGTQSPIPFVELVEVTDTTLSIAQSIATGKAISRDQLGAPLGVVRSRDRGHQ